jgi:hypothetical protein
MSNVHNLFDFRKDDPLIVSFVTFLRKGGIWLDQKLYDNFHTPEVLNTLIQIRRTIPRSDDLKAAYINFTMQFKESDKIEFARLQDSIDERETDQSKINALTCPTDKWSNLNSEAKPKAPILCAIVAIRFLLEQRRFVLKYDVWRAYSLILNENGKEEYASVQIDPILREWRNWIYLHRGTMYSLETLKDAFHQLSANNEFHSQQDKVLSVKWDGVSRFALGTTVAFGLDSSEFTRRAFKHHLIASMARLFYPGVWYDLILCVFGNQGAGKTTGLRILYGRDNTISCNWFELDAKRKSEMTRHGIWAVENPDTFGDARKADFNRIKADTSVDSFLGRDAYGRMEDMRRHNITYVIWYTGNEIHVLRDPTGNRRFIIVYSVGPIDEDWLRLNADQLMAEAYVEMMKLRSEYLDELHRKGINYDGYPKYLELPRVMWEESKKRSDAAMADAPPWEDWLPDIIFQSFLIESSPKSNKKSLMVLTRDILNFLHEKSPRNTSISSQALANAMSKVVVLSKDKCAGLQEDIKWTQKEIHRNGSNPRGYRIDFDSESKLRALELIKEMITSRKSPEEYFTERR